MADHVIHHRSDEKLSRVANHVRAILIAGLLLLVGAYLDEPLNAKPRRRTTSFAIT